MSPPRSSPRVLLVRLCLAAFRLNICRRLHSTRRIRLSPRTFTMTTAGRGTDYPSNHRCAPATTRSAQRLYRSISRCCALIQGYSVVTRTPLTRVSYRGELSGRVGEASPPVPGWTNLVVVLRPHSWSPIDADAADVSPWTRLLRPVQSTALQLSKCHHTAYQYSKRA